MSTAAKPNTETNNLHGMQMLNVCSDCPILKYQRVTRKSTQLSFLRTLRYLNNRADMLEM